MKKTLALLACSTLFSALGYSAPFCDPGLTHICGAARIGYPTEPTAYLKVWACVSTSTTTDQYGHHALELKKVKIGDTVFNSLKPDPKNNGYVLNINNKQIRLLIDHDAGEIYLRVWAITGYSKVDEEMAPDLTDLAFISYRFNQNGGFEPDQYCTNFSMINSYIDCPSKVSSRCKTCKLAVTSVGGYITNVEEIATISSGKEQIKALAIYDSPTSIKGSSIVTSSGYCAENYNKIFVDTQFKATPQNY